MVAWPEIRGGGGWSSGIFIRSIDSVFASKSIGSWSDDWPDSRRGFSPAGSRNEAFRWSRLSGLSTRWVSRSCVRQLSKLQIRAGQGSSSLVESGQVLPLKVIAWCILITNIVNEVAGDGINIVLVISIIDS